MINTYIYIYMRIHHYMVISNMVPQVSDPKHGHMATICTWPWAMMPTTRWSISPSIYTLW